MSTPYPVRASVLVLASILVSGSAPAFAQGTAEQQEACTPDALKLCSATIPDIAKTTACMKAHVADLSPRCRAAFATATVAPTKTAKAPAPEKTAKAPLRVSEKTAARTVKPAPHFAARPLRPSRGEERTVVTRTPEIEPAPDAPPFPSPAAVAAIPIPEAVPESGRTTRHSLATLCREGLIDAFTCRTTIPTMGLGD